MRKSVVLNPIGDRSSVPKERSPNSQTSKSASPIQSFAPNSAKQTFPQTPERIEEVKGSVCSSPDGIIHQNHTSTSSPITSYPQSIDAMIAKIHSDLRENPHGDSSLSKTPPTPITPPTIPKSTSKQSLSPSSPNPLPPVSMHGKHPPKHLEPLHIDHHAHVGNLTTDDQIQVGHHLGEEPPLPHSQSQSPLSSHPPPKIMARSGDNRNNVDSGASLIKASQQSQSQSQQQSQALSSSSSLPSRQANQDVTSAQTTKKPLPVASQPLKKPMSKASSQSGVQVRVDQVASKTTSSLPKRLDASSGSQPLQTGLSRVTGLNSTSDNGLSATKDSSHPKQRLTSAPQTALVSNQNGPTNSSNTVSQTQTGSITRSPPVSSTTNLNGSAIGTKSKALTGGVIGTKSPSPNLKSVSSTSQVSLSNVTGQSSDSSSLHTTPASTEGNVPKPAIPLSSNGGSGGHKEASTQQPQTKSHPGITYAQNPSLEKKNTNGTKNVQDKFPNDSFGDLTADNLDEILKESGVFDDIFGAPSTPKQKHRPTTPSSPLIKTPGESLLTPEAKQGAVTLDFNALDDEINALGLGSSAFESLAEIVGNTEHRSSDKGRPSKSKTSDKPIKGAIEQGERGMSAIDILFKDLDLMRKQVADRDTSDYIMFWIKFDIFSRGALKESDSFEWISSQTVLDSPFYVPSKRRRSETRILETWFFQHFDTDFVEVRYNVDDISASEGEFRLDGSGWDRVVISAKWMSRNRSGNCLEISRNRQDLVLEQQYMDVEKFGTGSRINIPRLPTDQKSSRELPKSGWFTLFFYPNFVNAEGSQEDVVSEFVYTFPVSFLSDVSVAKPNELGVQRLFYKENA
eukprot:TRINITY_DN2280_c0_g3_i2.p1 TRINITY_DN2280_c0_g3~~TRINITY_DN2280_c0_g3_i2.p1  ORF type:complete len:852 (+),score=150.66 TRINITY_DN2280_c0_g3_i2:234-2789(+)